MKDQLSCASYLVCHQFTLLLQRMKSLVSSRRWDVAVPFCISASTSLGMYKASCLHLFLSFLTEQQPVNQLGLPSRLSRVSGKCCSSLGLANL